MNDERFKWIEHKPHQVLQAEERPLLFQKLPGAEEMWDYELQTGRNYFGYFKGNGKLGVR